MPKVVSFSTGLKSVLFWSIISAAFIGPGTVATASKAGSSYQLDILWALIFSIFATIILQETAARIALASGKSLGQIIGLQYGQKQSSFLATLLFLSVFIGCAAYQAGNILGAIAGLELFLSDSLRLIFIFLIVLICGGLLYVGNFKIIGNILGLIVAGMGIAFISIAFQSDVAFAKFASAATSPSLPQGSELLIIGLIGTTIVPYNLFLTSGISKGQSILEMRVGIITAIIIGGIISIAIMVVGTNIKGAFSFARLAEVMNEKTNWKFGSFLLGFGLFAAGLSSSITAPLAAAVTAKSMFEKDKEKSWSVKGKKYKLVWILVLLFGLITGLLRHLMDFQPVGIIVLAQAVNGILLPLITIFLLFVANDKNILGSTYSNSLTQNILTLCIVGVTCFLGLHNLFSALGKISGLSVIDYWYIILTITIVITLLLAYLVLIRKEKITE